MASNNAQKKEKPPILFGGIKTLPTETKLCRERRRFCWEWVKNL